MYIFSYCQVYNSWEHGHPWPSPVCSSATLRGPCLEKGLAGRCPNRIVDSSRTFFSTPPHFIFTPIQTFPKITECKLHRQLSKTGETHPRPMCLGPDHCSFWYAYLSLHAKKFFAAITIGKKKERRQDNVHNDDCTVEERKKKVFIKMHNSLTNPGPTNSVHYQRESDRALCVWVIWAKENRSFGT